jgi:hypothetical protein
MWVWMCWINIAMFELTYFMAECVRLRCVGLDIVEGLVKTVDVFDKSMSGGRADLIFQNARCKERMRKSVYSGTQYTFPGLLLLPLLLLLFLLILLFLLLLLHLFLLLFLFQLLFYCYCNFYSC